MAKWQNLHSSFKYKQVPMKFQTHKVRQLSNVPPDSWGQVITFAIHAVATCSQKNSQSGISELLDLVLSVQIHSSCMFIVHCNKVFSKINTIYNVQLPHSYRAFVHSDFPTVQKNHV